MRSRRFWTETLGLTLVLSLLLSLSCLAAQLKVVFINVGQGDSILIQFPNGQIMLVDAGPRGAKVRGSIFTELERAGVKRIDEFVITHPDADHIGEALTVIKSFQVDRIWDTGYVPSPKTKTYSDLYDAALSQLPIQREAVRQGQRIDIDPATRVKVLWPIEEVMSSKESNDTSIVLKLTYRDTSVLFMGDAPPDPRLLTACLKAQVLKVSHHGSKENTTKALLEAIDGQPPDAKIAVISAGTLNRYRHPSLEVLNLLEEFGYRVYRTDVNGTVVLTSDGTRWTVKPERGDARPLPDDTAAPPA